MSIRPTQWSVRPSVARAAGAALFVGGMMAGIAWGIVWTQWDDPTKAPGLEAWTRAPERTADELRHHSLRLLTALDRRIDQLDLSYLMATVAGLLGGSLTWHLASRVRSGAIGALPPE